MTVGTEQPHKETPLEAHHEAHQHEHPSDLVYIKVFALLGVLTALEVGTYFIENASTAFLVAGLIPLMVIKFGVVCAYFMHLKYDNPLFRRVFVFGLLLAIAVYVGVLTSMQFWDSGYGT
ncbi:MAG TPA: cytochrome C oxidase subunit IV family protein [Acidimicrobiales bacterium]|nr:cytochrome C oxidase subunit IV family protein [Acidimicrobiales bacterium]